MTARTRRASPGAFTSPRGAELESAVRIRRYIVQAASKTALAFDTAFRCAASYVSAAVAAPAAVPISNPSPNELQLVCVDPVIAADTMPAIAPPRI